MNECGWPLAEIKGQKGTVPHSFDWGTAVSNVPKCKLLMRDSKRDCAKPSDVKPSRLPNKSRTKPTVIVIKHC